LLFFNFYSSIERLLNAMCRAAVKTTCGAFICSFKDTGHRAASSRNSGKDPWRNAHTHQLLEQELASIGYFHTTNVLRERRQMEMAVIGKTLN
jgi:hypothetical protein